MKLTPLDIRQKTFEKSFRGIDKDEVQAFLNTLSQQWEKMQDESRELRLKLDHAQQDVQKMREVESSLYRTLKTAEDTSAAITEQAQRDADLRIREAQLQAEQLLAEARQRARALTDESQQTAEKIVADMQREVASMGQNCQRLEQQLDTLVRDLHHLATDALDKVEKARGRAKTGPAAILSRAAAVQVERPKEPAAETETAMFVTAATSSFSPGMAAAPAAPAAPAAYAAPEPTGAAKQPAAVEAAVALPAAVADNQPTSYNPKPGQQPDPYTPATAPSPEIERPAAPAENPGTSPAPQVPNPGPAQVPEPPAPQVEPVRPDIQPVTPSHPEVSPPSPNTHPGGPMGGGGSFFDEI